MCFFLFLLFRFSESNLYLSKLENFFYTELSFLRETGRDDSERGLINVYLYILLAFGLDRLFGMIKSKKSKENNL